MALAVAGERYTLRSRESSSTLRWLLAFSLPFKVRPSWLLRIAIGAAVLAARTRGHGRGATDQHGAGAGFRCAV